MPRTDFPDPKDGDAPEQDARGQFARTTHGSKSDGVASANPRATSKNHGADATPGSSGHGRDRAPGESG
jgi:hypothetical protein